ncbi:hypothetical protein PT974_05545 [Cladobotryum mycophilum]|uniref:Uncharacterized protein n=1 Tax=Cladobotryum mycophilum TaxID=491253 RepID=A0ABR0SK55_9HYPO
MKTLLVLTAPPAISLLSQLNQSWWTWLELGTECVKSSQGHLLLLGIRPYHSSQHKVKLSSVAMPPFATDRDHLSDINLRRQREFRYGSPEFRGNPNFTDCNIASYVEGFKTDILGMHPIIHPEIIDEWVRCFLDSNFVISQSQIAYEMVGSKRKRLLVSEGHSTTQTSMRSGARSLSTRCAVVLMIFALGKVCFLYNMPSSASPSSKAGPSGNQESHTRVLSTPTSQGFYTGSPSYSNPPAPQILREQGRRASTQCSDGSTYSSYGPENHEITPGMEYFALATEILDNDAGRHADMDILYANLFVGCIMISLRIQWRVLRSSRKSMDSLRTIEKGTGFIQHISHNQITLAFWACLQLEGDLLTEFPMTESGILQFGNDMPDPNMSLLRGFNQQTLDSYLAHLYLWKHLNSIDRVLDTLDDADTAGSEKAKNVKLVADAIIDMCWVPHGFMFTKDDMPARDTLSARLRYRFWGVLVVIYRHFIKQVLEVEAPSQLDDETIDLAKKGIKSLIESIRAFDRLDEAQPIVGNVFGVAHA